MNYRTDKTITQSYSRPISETFGYLRSTLKKSRGRGGRFMACCPVHDDKDPSLSVTLASDRILFNCFSQKCDYKAIAAACNLEPKDLFDNPFTIGTSNGNGHKKSKSKQLDLKKDPIIDLAVEAMGATRDDAYKWIEQKRAFGTGEEEIRQILVEMIRTQPELEVSQASHPSHLPQNGTDGTFVSGLIVKTMNEWIEEAAMSPTPKMLFSELVVENEVTIFFGETAANKTVLAVQIAEWAADGREIRGFENNAGKKKALFLDCELSPKQQEKRYSELKPGSDFFCNHYKFSENFDRAELRLDRCPKGMELQDYIFLSINQEVAEHGYDFLIVDNISALGSHTEQARFAIPLMHAINRLKTKCEITVLVLAHTPKRDSSRPLHLNDLQGSASLRNLCDAVFAIGKSQKDVGVRYIKQLKPRSVDMIYGEDNVIVCHVSKDSNFLGLEFKGYSAESEHLSIRTDEEKQDLAAQVQRLHLAGKSLREIEKDTGIAKSTVSRMLSHPSQRPNEEEAGQPGQLEMCDQCGKREAFNHGICIFCSIPVNGDK